MIGFLVVFASGAPVAGARPPRADIEDAANTVLVVTFGDGPVARPCGPGGLAVDRHAVPQFPGRADRGRDLGTGAAAFVFERSRRAHAARISVQTAQMIIDPGGSDRVRGCLDRVRAPGIRRVGNGHRLVRIDHHWVVLSWWMAKWRPFRGRFSFRIWREMAGFSLPLFLDGIAERAREMFEQVLVGRSLGTADLGQYRYAYRIASLPSLAVIRSVATCCTPRSRGFPATAARFRAAFLRALGWIWFAALPVGALLVVVGQPVVVLLLGEEWRSAGAATAAMAGIGLGTALVSVGGEAIKGAGRSSLLNWMTALSLGLGLPTYRAATAVRSRRGRHRDLGHVSGRRRPRRRTRPLAWSAPRSARPLHAFGRPRSRRRSPSLWCCRWNVSSSGRTTIRCCRAWRGSSRNACCSHSSTSARCG